jgi:N-acetylglutamate synthase-like GNAT family acetyltransferase
MKLNSTEETTDYGKIWKYEAQDKSFHFAIYKYSDDDDTYYLANVFVDESRREEGFGNVILSTAEDMAEKANAKIMCLKAKTDSFVHNWYKRHGYTDIGIDETEPSYTWMKKNLNTVNLMKKKLFILFPGGFKPVHSAHIMLAQNAYDKLSAVYDVHIYFIISKTERDGIPAQPSIDFMKKMFETVPYMDLVVCDSGSPLRMAYTITGEKRFGDGYYTILSSTKESDWRRTEDFCKAFMKNGKYYTPGVKPLLVGPFSAPLEFCHRTDHFNGCPMSSLVLRQDLQNDEFENFFSGYRLLIETNWITNEMLDKYYNDLRTNTGLFIGESIVYNQLNEGGVGGHICNPYEINEMSFTDLFSLVTDLFTGNIEDVTEKVDGMNLYASVNLKGEPIFARNKHHISEQPFLLDDIRRNGMWTKTPTISDAFREGAYAIAAVFNNIPNAVDFFNTVDVNGRLRFRKWVNFEVVDPNNVNVISYSTRMILIHSIELIGYDSPDGIFYPDYDRSLEQAELDRIGEAIAKTTYKDTSIGLTPKIILDKHAENADEAKEICDEIFDLISEYGVSQLDTIGDFMLASAKRYLSTKSEFKHLSPDMIERIARYLLKDEDANGLLWFKKFLSNDDFIKLRAFRRSKRTEFKRTIGRPLEMILAKAGNRILKNLKNTINSKNQDAVKGDIKKRIVSAIDMLEKNGDEKSKDKLEQLLAKMETLDNTVNAIEGIVFEYKGRLIKITGSFGIINQILNMNQSLS